MGLSSQVKTLFRTQSLSHARSESSHGLRRTLGVWDLTSLGVAAIIGAGIFSTIGNAVHDGGPAAIFLFLLTAVACAFSAVCYAEFASQFPISGSAYTYAYVSFGEVIAWIIGWDLLMEYAISNIAVAISWSEYFSVLLRGYGIQIPPHLSIDALSAYRSFSEISPLIEKGKTLAQLVEGGIASSTVAGYLAWMDAPKIFGLPLICNLPALGVTAVVTGVAYIGIREAKLTSNLLVILKLLVILLVIVVGGFYVNPANWVPFAPHGSAGVLKGVSAVFFAYIGFDAISTTAEECVNPQRDLPRGMFYSLGICTALYVLVSLVLTGIVPYSKLAVADPLAYVFGPDGANLPMLPGIIAVSAVISLFTVMLVYQLGQPRIWMSMSRDGLLPPIFGRIHPRFKTPGFSTILTGFFVAIPSLFMNLTEVTNLASIGTLFAFSIVCAGVLNPKVIKNRMDPKRPPGFRIPYINSQYIFPGLTAAALTTQAWMSDQGIMTFFSGPSSTVFTIFVIAVAALCSVRKYSLIPILGLVSCSFLISELGLTNWIRFGVWLAIGLLIYFCYGYKHSHLNRKNARS